MTAPKLTPAERGRLGGLTAAHRLGREGVAARGRKGGEATLEKYGRAQFVRLNHIRTGKLGRSAS